MKALKAYLEGKKLYMLFIHVAVIALAVEVVVLARQNNELKNPKDRGGKEQLAVGDSLSIHDLKPLQANYILPVNAPNQLLFVFTTTCPFCKENLINWKKLMALANKNKLTIVGISLDSAEKSEAYINEHQIDFPVFVPLDLASFKSQNKLNAVPVTVIRDSTGVAQKIWRGLLKEEQLREVANAISDIKPTTIIGGPL